MAGAYGVVVAEPEAKRIVYAWRDARQPTVRMWEEIEHTAWWATANPGKQVSCCAGRVVYWHNGTDLLCRLPSGRWIAYPETRCATENFELPDGEKERRTVLRSSFALGAVWTSQRLWRGILVENIVQATARDVLVPALGRVERVPGMRPVLHVHDSILAEVRDPALAAVVEQELVRPPQWADGLPIGAKVTTSDRWG
jgi:DNA polymerase